MALIHYPVINKNGETIASAITNLDLHDIARAVKTYSARSFFVVTPLVDQQKLARRILRHWTNGVGGQINPARRKALASIRICETLAQVAADIEADTGCRPVTVATCARNDNGRISYAQFRKWLGSGLPHILVLGTAWGLAEQFLESADYVLAPIRGTGEYNHLSVRSAAAIILDRLLGPQD